MGQIAWCFRRSIGGPVAVGVAVGIFWRRIKAFLGRMFSRFKHYEASKDRQHQSSLEEE